MERYDGRSIEIEAYFNEPGQVFDENETQACSASSQRPVCVIMREISRAQQNGIPEIYVAMSQFLKSSDKDGDKYGTEAQRKLLAALKDYSGSVWVRASRDYEIELPDGSFDKVSNYLSAVVKFCAGDPVGGIMHHKFLILGDTVITGSLNWNASSLEDNNENIVIIRNPKIAQRYKQEFFRIWRDKCEESGIIGQ